MRRLLTPDQFSEATDHGKKSPPRDVALYRFAGGQAEDIALGQDNRTVSYVFSTDAVARDNHTIDQSGWVLDNFKQNPVFLWAHDAEQPPIGEVVDIGVSGGALRGRVRYAERDLYPFADMIYQMVKRGLINAVSVSWLPIEWKFSQDRARLGGIDFKRQELLEISQVPLPAEPSALAAARSYGIDTGPLVEWAGKILDGGGMLVVPRAELENLRKEAKMPLAAQTRSGADWKCGAARDLPIDENAAWDGAEAKKAIFDACGFDGDSPDTERARKHFLAYDAANASLKGSYKLPFATIVDGKSKAVAAGIRNAASRLPQTKDLPDSVISEARNVLDDYEKRMGGEKKNQAGSGVRRDLCAVSQLAWLLEQLGWLQDCTEFEAEIEQDNSDIPGRLAKIISDAGLVLVDMTKEEVAELLASVSADPAAVEQAAQSKAQRILRLMLTAGHDLAFARARQAQRPPDGTRAGKVLSAANVEALTRAMEYHRQMGECIQGVLDSASAATADDAEIARAIELRKRELEHIALSAP